MTVASLLIQGRPGDSLGLIGAVLARAGPPPGGMPWKKE
jgi:hypothetical protein